jgi:uncharacterized protein (TIGR00299 family) protein
MVDMGIPVETLASGLYGLGLDIRLDVNKVRKHGIAGTKLDVIIPDTANERHLTEILDIINGSALESDIKETAGRIFRRLGEAEARVHGIGIEKVHFHEIGALDTIADVVGAAICYKLSGAEALYSSPVNVGSGFVKTSHGMLPVPAPATLELLKGASIYSTGIQAELVTPTGAAILAELCKGYGPMPHLQAEKTGYGAGTKDLEAPNMLRAILGEKVQKAHKGQD